MATKLSIMVTYLEELVTIKPNNTLITLLARSRDKQKL